MGSGNAIPGSVVAERPGLAGVTEEPHIFWAWWAPRTVKRDPCVRWEMGLAAVSVPGTPALSSRTGLSRSAWLGDLGPWGGMSCPRAGERLRSRAPEPGLREGRLSGQSGGLAQLR